MKRIIVIGLALMLIILSCPKKETPALRLSPQKWNETNTYQILTDTTVSGKYQLIYRTFEEAGEEKIELYSLTEIMQGNAVSTDSTRLVIKADDLRPLLSDKVIFTSGTSLSSVTIYGKNKAEVKAKLPQGEKSADIPININTYDNDQVTTILRAIELKPDEEKEINVVIGFSGTTVPVKIKSSGEEKIIVSAGEFDCHKYTITVVGRMIDVWYEKADAKRMVKYFDAQANMTMELMP